MADRAQVTVQTIIRHFRNRDGLFAAALEREATNAEAGRLAGVAPGDLHAAVHALVDHYEEFGERVLRLLSAAAEFEGAKKVAERGKAGHRDWCAALFKVRLESLAPAERSIRLAQLVTVCDVQVWALLRRDCGLSRADTERALVELLAPLAKEN